MNYTSTEIKNAFKVLKNDAGEHPGMMHIDELVHNLSIYGSDENLSEERIRELVTQMEFDQKGFVNYPE